MSVSKNSEKKVKRPAVNWFEEMKYIADPRIEAAFYAMWKRLGFGSKNRAAYNALKMYYSTTAMTSFRWLGGHLEDYEL